MNFRYFCFVVLAFDVHALKPENIGISYSCKIKAVSITVLKYFRVYTQQAQLYYFIVSSPQSCYLQKINSYMVVIIEH